MIVMVLFIFVLIGFVVFFDLKWVMLLSGGVGYFEYEVEVEGDIEFEFLVCLD